MSNYKITILGDNSALNQHVLDLINQAQWSNEKPDVEHFEMSADTIGAWLPTEGFFKIENLGSFFALYYFDGETTDAIKEHLNNFHESVVQLLFSHPLLRENVVIFPEEDRVEMQQQFEGLREVLKVTIVAQKVQAEQTKELDDMHRKLHEAHEKLDEIQQQAQDIKDNYSGSLASFFQPSPASSSSTPETQHSQNFSA